MTHIPTSDVVIIGGGVVGSSIAFFLADEDAFTGTVTVVEKDPTYAESSTALSVGGIRQQFSTPENIEMSKFGARFFRSTAQRLGVDDSRPDVSFVEAGYLILATREGLDVLGRNQALQTAHGAAIDLRSPSQLRRRFPWLHTADLAGGALGLRDEGWIDPYSLMMAFKAKAQSLGASYIDGEVVAVHRRGDTVAGVRLSDGRQLAAGCVVNAAGPRADQIASLAGIRDLPVRSRKRLVFTFQCREKIPDCPLVVDPCGLYFRPEGDRFLCGISPPADQDPDCRDFKVDPRCFEEVLWPALAHRVPAFDALRQRTAWAGHYAYNVRDQNAVLGPHPEVGNFYFANGFSGHGLQQSPAVGRAICELIAFGAYRSLDLARLGFDRFAAGRLVRERNVI